MASETRRPRTPRRDGASRALQSAWFAVRLLFAQPSRYSYPGLHVRLIQDVLDRLAGVIGELVDVELTQADLVEFVDQDRLVFGVAAIGRMVPWEQIGCGRQHEYLGDIRQLGGNLIELVTTPHVEAAARAAQTILEALDTMALPGVEAREDDPRLVRVLAGHRHALAVRRHLAGVLAGWAERVRKDVHLERVRQLGDLARPRGRGEAGHNGHANLLTLEEILIVDVRVVRVCRARRVEPGQRLEAGFRLGGVEQALLTVDVEQVAAECAQEPNNALIAD